jgi:hypothetical protein
VNIAAVMAALDVWDLDRNVKHALVVVCCRADQYTGAATVSIPRVAADMKVSYRTALGALDRAVEAGYLTVDKTLGKTSTWHLTPAIHASDPCNPRHRPLQPGCSAKDKKDKDKERAAAPLSSSLSVVAGENPPADAYAHYPNWTVERLNGATP